MNYIMYIFIIILICFTLFSSREVGGKMKSISSTSNVMFTDYAQIRKKREIHTVLKTPSRLRTRRFWAKIGNMNPVESETRTSKDKIEVPSRGDFCDQGTDGYKEHCGMLQWIPYLLCREIPSLQYPPGFLQHSVSSI